MKITINQFEIIGVEGMANVAFTATINGEEIECTHPLRKDNREDIVFLQAVEQFVKTKVGEAT